MTENQIFDAVRQPPAALLRQAYEEHQVLVLSFMQHENERQLQALNSLLGQVGRDRRLKYIVLERFAEDAPVLETMSIQRLDETQLQREMRQQYLSDSGFLARASLCGVPEWAYTWGELLPSLRKLNATRPVDRKVVVTAVDGGLAAGRAGYGLTSYVRDSTTAAQFHEKIWRELRRDTAAKAIVVYNIAHTIGGFVARRQDRTTPASFLSMFLGDHPDARPRTALVMIEGSRSEKDEFTYQFRLTERQVGRTGGRPFAVRTAPFRDAVAERGDSVLTANALHPCLAGTCQDGHQSTATLADMVDALVWLPKSEQPHFKPSSEYLPTACAEAER